MSQNLRCLQVQNFPYNFQQIWRSITKFILQTSGHPNKKTAARPERKIKKDFFQGKHFSFTKAYKLWFLFCLVGAVAMTCPSFVLAVFACGGASFLRKFSGPTTLAWHQSYPQVAHLVLPTEPVVLVPRLQTTTPMMQRLTS